MWRSAGEALRSLQVMNQRVIQQKFYGPLRAIKLSFNTRKVWRLKFQYVCIPKNFLHVAFYFDRLEFFIYFSMFKTPLESVTLRWAAASSRLNT